MAERLSVEQDVVGSSPTSLPFLFNEILRQFNAWWRNTQYVFLCGLHRSKRLCR